MSDQPRSPSTGISALGSSTSGERETILLVDDHADTVTRKDSVGAANRAVAKAHSPATERRRLMTAAEALIARSDDVLQRHYGTGSACVVCASTAVQTAFRTPMMVCRCRQCGAVWEVQRGDD